METHPPTIVVIVAIIVAMASWASAGTILTFEDPALDGSTPLFTVNLIDDEISGSWSDAAAGLNLNLMNVTGIGIIFSDAFFVMDALSITEVKPGAWEWEVAEGEIRFYEDNASTQLPPLISISFASAFLWTGGFGAEDSVLRADDVTIVIEYLGQTYTFAEETFGFGFSNQRYIDPSSPDDGFTATAAFTSTGIPEPAALLFLAVGVAVLAQRRRYA